MMSSTHKISYVGYEEVKIWLQPICSKPVSASSVLNSIFGSVLLKAQPTSVLTDVYVLGICNFLTASWVFNPVFLKAS